MRILSVVPVIALLAVAAPMLGGCCEKQNQEIQSLTVMNRQLKKDMYEKQAEIARLQERIDSLQAGGKSIDAVVQGKNDMIRNLQDRIDTLQAALDKRDREYEALVNKMGSMPTGGGTQLAAPVVHALRALQSSYPNLFTYDEATGRLRFASDVTFDSGKADVKSEARNALTRLAGILTQAEAQNVAIEAVGHTDNVPVRKPETVRLYKNNQGLSEARAKAVKDILVANGVSSGRITTRGMGAKDPISSNDSADGRAKNRRVDIYLRAGS